MLTPHPIAPLAARLRSLAVCGALLALLALPATAQLAPGAPAAGGGGFLPNQPVDLTNGNNPLTFLATPGFVVLLEDPRLTDEPRFDPSNWSDVVEFRVTPGSTLSEAFLTSDLESGFSDPQYTALVNRVRADNANLVFQDEVQKGTGTDADFTPYPDPATKPAVSYRIHSDAAGVETNDTEVPEPSAFGLLALGLVPIGLLARKRRAA